MSDRDETLASRIFAHTVSAPHAHALTIVMGIGLREQAFSRRELLDEAERYAARLAARGVRSGDVVILLFEHGPELIFSFLGALRIGAVPTVFAPPSVKIAPPVYRRTLLALCRNSGATHLITDRERARVLEDGGPLGLEIVLVGEIGDAPPVTPTTGDPDRVAMLQYSSGTTGLRKGVALSSRSLLRQIDAYSAAIHLDEDDRIVSWLPLYHDMGLVACFLLPLARGVPVTLLSPLDWVRRPVSLLEVIHLTRATLCWLPNFAYNVLATRISDAAVAGLDLGSMRAFVNCSEPIAAQSHALFRARFAPLGLREDALTTCYAMAENTFAVTQGGIDEPVASEELDEEAYATLGRAVIATDATRRRRAVVSSGRPIDGCEVRIVGPEHAPVGDRVVGEIAIRSDCLLGEYHRQPELTAAALVDGWYFTGDVGYLAEGHLFVTGREKDLIIVAGRNLHPEDIEALTSSVDGVHPGRVVAFGVPDERLGTEALVVVAETEVESAEGRRTIMKAIAERVSSHLDCSVRDVVLLPHRTLAKSSSGKIARSANRESYFRDWRSA